MNKLLAVAIAALALSACGSWSPPAGCDGICILKSDGGCSQVIPMCNQHCGGPTCPRGYTLEPDSHAGVGCDAGEHLICL